LLLQLKMGALHLLQHFRVLGKKTMIIRFKAEGPSATQQWTMAALGIAPYVDVLMTTNDMGKLKIDGLFGSVVQRFRIKPDEMVYIGDSATRDIAPARLGGIWSWLYVRRKRQLRVRGRGAQDKFSDENEVYFGRKECYYFVTLLSMGER
jgi:putative hydrolase of the HAD superfamily